jgi:hypothetical protein
MKIRQHSMHGLGECKEIESAVQLTRPNGCLLSKIQAIVKEKDRQNYTGTPFKPEVQFSGNAPDLF